MSDDQTQTDQYSHLELKIDALNTDGHYNVEAVVDGERHLQGRPLEQDRVESWLTMPEPDRISAQMSELLFSEGVEIALELARSRQPDRVRMRVQISPNAPELQRLPWEGLLLPKDREVPVGIDERRPFARLIVLDSALSPDPSPVGVSPIRLLIVLDSALAGGDEDLKPESLLPVVDALRDHVESGRLDATLWLWPAGRPNMERPAYETLTQSGFKVISDLPETVNDMLGTMHIVHHTSINPRQVDWVQNERRQVERHNETFHPVTANLLSWLDKAEDLPPLIVLTTPDETGRLAGDARTFTARGNLATIAMSPADPSATWSALRSFYGELMEHGLVDLAANRLRAGQLEQRGADPHENAVLWTTLRGGRLFAPASARRQEDDPLARVQQKEVRAPLEVEYLEDAIRIGDQEVAVEDDSAGRDVRQEKRPRTKRPVEPDIQEIVYGDEHVDDGPADETPVVQQPEPEEVTVDNQETTRASDGAPPAADRPAAIGTSRPDAAPVVIHQNIRVDLTPYDPPAEDHKIQVTVNRDSVTVEFRGDQYEGPNRLADEAVRAELNYVRRTDHDWSRYGRLLYDAILSPVENDTPAGQDTDNEADNSHDTSALFGFRKALQELRPIGNGAGIEREQRLRLELVLNRAVPWLHDQAWEYLRAGTETPLALLESSPLYRRLTGPRRSLSVRGANRPKILIAICNPTQAAEYGLEPLDVTLERRIAESALSRLRAAGLLDYHILPEQPDGSVTLEEIQGAIQRGCHVLHLICHGLTINAHETGHGYRLFIERTPSVAGAAGSPLVTPTELRNTFGGTASKPRLLILSACRSAAGPGEQTLRALGPRMVTDARLPAVIAMQEDLPFSTAQLFMQSFYDHLARSGRIDMAMAATRLSIATAEGEEQGTWGIPVLYMSTDDGMLLDVDAERAATLPRLPADIRTPQQLGAPEDPRLAALRRRFTQEAHAAGAPALAGALTTAFQSAAGTSVDIFVTRQARATLSVALDPHARLEFDALKQRISAGGLQLEDDAYHQIAAAINMGKHIILLGPPGTGKTSLAHAICDYAQSLGFCCGKTVTTATADWTTFDTVGGYVPTQAQTLEFRPGSFLSAICDGNWLVIDEINRAEIDKAFGELFTVLSGQQVDTPHTVGEHRVRILPYSAHYDRDRRESWIPARLPENGYDYVVHPNWRIIGTMNVYDRSSLYAMSLAFMRRFAFIDLDPPGATENLALWQRWTGSRSGLLDLASGERTALHDILAALTAEHSQLMRHRALGPAIIKDMIAYVRERYRPPSTNARATMADLVAEAFLLFAAPQLDGLDAQAVTGVYKELGGLFQLHSTPKREDILDRIQALYPFVPLKTSDESE